MNEIVFASDAHHLKAAEGWLELGNHLEANNELENITASLRAHPDVLKLRWRIYEKAGKWDVCVDLAAALVAWNPQDPEWWIHRSFALHELKRTEEAFNLLEPAAYHFPSNEIVLYSLACYSCQLGNQDEAWHWLVQAFETAKDRAAIKTMALEDKDLEPFWAEIGEI